VSHPGASAGSAALRCRATAPLLVPQQPVRQPSRGAPRTGQLRPQRGVDAAPEVVDRRVAQGARLQQRLIVQTV
jgi:hypothetical protein